MTETNTTRTTEWPSKYIYYFTLFRIYNIKFNYNVRGGEMPPCLQTKCKNRSNAAQLHANKRVSEDIAK